MMNNKTSVFRVLERNDIFPVVKIYCNKRNGLWFKFSTNNPLLLRSKNTSVIFTKNRHDYFFISGIDYAGDYFYYVPCDSFEKAKHISFVNPIRFYLYIRGHVRNSFETHKLRHFMDLLKLNFPNVIPVFQTWKHIQCFNGESWRKTEESTKMISLKHIQDYFGMGNIRCDIIDEKDIIYNGSIEGKIDGTLCPKKGWKNMWYGIHRGMKNITDESDDVRLLSFRFDYFDIYQSINISISNILLFISESINNNNIQFICGDNCEGVDNCYIGKLSNIKKLTHEFYFNLDNILEKHDINDHQECLVSKVARELVL